MAALTSSDTSLLNWIFQHYHSVNISMSRDHRDEVGGEQWSVSTFGRTKTWCTGTGLSLSDAVKNLISRINKVENEKTIWTPL